MEKINHVVAGDYEGWEFKSSSSIFDNDCCIRLYEFFVEKERIDLNKQTVKYYNIIDKSSNNPLLHMYGISGESDEYLIDIKFSDNTKALICADEKSYRHFISVMF